jgi:hypothetical protein
LPALSDVHAQRPSVQLPESQSLSSVQASPKPLPWHWPSVQLPEVQSLSSVQALPRRHVPPPSHVTAALAVQPLGSGRALSMSLMHSSKQLGLVQREKHSGSKPPMQRSKAA